MAFVQLTWAQNKGPFAFNVDHIVGVRPHNEMTVIILSPPGKDGLETRNVTESFDEVMQRLEIATARR